MLSNPHEFVLPAGGVVSTVTRKVTETLAKVGVRVVCCGGAARDAYHFCSPKDFDFIVLGTPDLDEDEFDDNLQAAMVGWALNTDPDFTSIRIMLSYSEGSMQLHWVIKANYKSHSIDIINPTRRCCEPADAVRGLDVTLNSAWIDVTTPDTLCVTLPGVYPDVADDIAVRLIYPKSCTAERVDYIRSKYPQYRYDISQADLLTQPEGAL